MSIEKKHPLFTGPMEAISGLSINDLNKYLPAIQKVEDLFMTADKMKDGIFLGLGSEGFKKIPDNSIDLIIVDPPESPLQNLDKPNKRMKINEYYKWNDGWLNDSIRVLKPTGAIYLICGWKFSGMYQSILSNYFQIQTRITWRNTAPKNQTKPLTWINRT